MGPDCYKIEILHYLNPHLIWVEVIDHGTKPDEYVFEQIGIYGLLPLETTLDEADESFKVQRCETWLPAAAAVMKEALLQAAEIFFSPVHIDRRTTVFDDNIHKYGEIIIVRPCGKKKLLSKALVKSGFAFKDECLFHTELHSGNLKTKLSSIKVKEVIKNLEQFYSTKQRPKNQWEKSVKKQTSIFHKAQHLESTLTTKNLEVHNMKQSKDNKSLTIEMLMQKKIKDFDKCKGIDEESVGRGSVKDHVKVEKPLKKDLDTPLLNKKLKLLQDAKKDVVSDPLSMFFATKQYLDVNAVRKDQEIEDDEQEMESDHEQKSIEIEKVTEIERNVEVPETKNQSILFDEDDNEYPRMKLKKPKKYSKSTSKIPEYDIRTQKRVAYGPPGTERHKLNLKIVSKETFIERYTPIEKFDEKIPKKDNFFGDVDSDVEIEDINSLREKPTKQPNIIAEERKPIQEDPKPVPSLDVSSEQENSFIKNSFLRKKMQIHREVTSKKHESSLSSISDTSNKDSSTSIEDIKQKSSKKTDLDSDDDSISDVIEKLMIDYPIASKPIKNEQLNVVQSHANHVNPFKNVDPNISVFVDKLVTPILMVHSKLNKRFQPSFELRDIPFTTNIMVILKNMNVDRPMTIQTVSWFSILRGYSIFMISPKDSGKTMGYIPAVCRLVIDSDNSIDNSGPVAIIVCATAFSVAEVEKMTKIFLSNKKVLAFYTGMNELDMTTLLLNGCDVLICTPSILVRLMQASDYGVDLRRLTSFVLDDCERLSEVYGTEIKYFQLKIKEMLKTRAEKELKVQYILASRVWCDFMEPLAKKAPDTVICIGAFQECVLYSKASTTASFVSKENKLNSVLDFLKIIDKSKKTVIVCRSDDEVEMLEKALVASRHVVFACNNKMTVQDLYNLSLALADYQDQVLGPVLVCCDSNLTHLNINDAHYLVHFSLPQLFSMFCKRFSVLNDNYASIFNKANGDVKIKILLEDDNVEQLPKILHFIKRCTNEVPKVFDDVSDKVLAEKDVMKAKKLVPICASLLALGECPDFWNCQERHAIIKEFDEPKEWMPTNGVVTFKILHYHNPVLYSARLLTNIVNGQTTKYPQTYNKLSMKIAMYYAKESNRKLHGVPEVGDVCAVSIKQNFFVRCQVIKILSHYPKGNPNYVLIKLIDEEKLERSRDINLYYLPDEMKATETYVAQILLGNIQPKDKDITYSDLARQHLQKITDKDEDLYLRGRISLSIGNCIIVDTLETCRDLTSMNKTVVRHDFKQELLESHAICNPDHIPKLEKLCQDIVPIKNEEIEPEIVKPVKELPKPRWAHLPTDLTAVYCAAAQNPGTFFIRLVKFNDCINILIKDIQKYVSDTTDTITDVNKGDIVIAKFPDDNMYERARIDEVYDEDKVSCFFVDQGDWRDVSTKHLVPITDKIMNTIPFQAVECKLIGIKPPGEDWTEFSTNWFTNCFDDNVDELKQLYVKYFTKENAEYTGGHKYGVALIDTNSDKDVIINQLMIELNLVQEIDGEIGYLTQLDYKEDENKSGDEEEWEKVSRVSQDTKEIDAPKTPLEQIFLKKPIRSVPLVASDEESEGSEEKWNCNITDDFMALFKPMGPKLKQNIPAIKDVDNVSIKSVETKSAIATDSQSDSDFSIIKNPVSVDQNLINKVKVLDSDDLTSPETTLLTENKPVKLDLIENIQDLLRKPKLCWRQNKSTVTIKIQLIGVEYYNLEIQERHLKFDAVANETKYAFDFDLYGIIDKKLSSHSDKGQYILVNLTKILNKTWLTLTRDGGIRKWIVYDVDFIETSSDEDEIPDDTLEKIVRSTHNAQSDSEEDELLDDIDFRYKK